MYTTKERAELADICYMTIEKECAKPTTQMNTALVDACIELANLLLNVESITETDLADIKCKIEPVSLRRRKKLKIRIIAAVVATILLLGTTVYAFSDWLVEVFGVETLQTIGAGDSVTVDNNVLDAAKTKTEFSTVDELYGFVDDSVLLPDKTDNVKFIKARYSIYDKYDLLRITWEMDGIEIRYIVTINDNMLNQSEFIEQEFEHYSDANQPYDIIDTGTGWQASTIIEQTQYTVFCSNKETLVEFIDSLE